MKRLLSTLLFLLFSVSLLQGQVVTADPEFPRVDQSVTIYFYATKGDQGLKGHIGDVYAHTGISTDQNANQAWKCVKNSWPTNENFTGNRSDTKLTRVEGTNNQYKLKINDIRAYYQDTSTSCSLAEDETIESMNFVFRNSDGSKEGKAADGKDIFVKVYENSLNVKFLQPTDNPSFIASDSSLAIKGISSSEQTTELALFIDGKKERSVSNDTLSYTFTPSTAGTFTMKLAATDGSLSDTLSQQLVVNPQINEQARPAGLQDGITYVDANTVRLSLFAPNKEFVYVIGDFNDNDWQPQAKYFMNRETVNADSTYYWIELNGLTAGKEYAFQYFVDGEIRVADPYSEKILDPYNDKYIDSQTYPNLKSYPQGKTEKIAGVLQPGKTAFNWQHNNYDRPDKENLVTYELLIRDFTANHNFATLTDSLDYLDSLGVNAIELMPIMEFDANSSWGYNPTFHLATDKYYGPAEDLKAFIDEAHSRGIAVILDMVLNHAWGPSPLARLWNDGDFGKPTTENPYLNREPKHNFNVGYDFNHESQATRYFVDRVNKYWLEEFNFDGFRFDLSKGFTQKNTLGNTNAMSQYDASRISILKRMADKIWAVDDSAYVILEHFAQSSEEQELSNYGMMLWGNANHNYAEATMGYHSGGKSNFSHVSADGRGWSKPHLVGYMESHDEERLMYKNLTSGNISSDEFYDVKTVKTGLERNKMAAAFFLTIPGPKLIWQFGELGYDISINKNGRTGEKPIKWSYYSDKERKKLYDTYKALIRLRNTHPAFTSSDSQLSLDVGNAVKKIGISHPDMEATIIGNFDVTSQDIKPGFASSGKWYRFFRGDSVNISNTDTTLTLAPGEFYIYTDKKIKSPDNDLISLVPSSIDVQISKSFSGTSSSQDYRLVALPGQVNKSLSNALNGDADVDWQAFWDNGKPNDYLVKYDDSSTFTLKSGNGFWVTSKRNFTFDQTVATVALNGNSQASIPLHEGWNIISNPLHVDIEWSKVSTANGGGLQPIWAFDGSYSQSANFTSARSGEAYYFYNDQGINNLLIPYEETSSKSKTETNTTELQLITEVNGDTTSKSSLVITDSNESTHADIIAPPSGFEGASLRFVGENEDVSRASSFAQIYCSPNHQGYKIDLILSATPGKTVTIRANGWQNSGANQLVLLNPQTGRKYNLANSDSITLTVDNEQTPLLLLTGDSRYINEQQDNFLPKQVEITPNYPNPFNPSTTLQYKLPKQMKVRVQVYNILGRRVSTLINNEVREAGIHTIRFDASRQSSGIYFAVFEIGDRRFVQKMMLIK
ncbi:alpha-amylase family glycosyl hydrolase [Fodinibius saliphilus]|uniref:alpha-amylase family glycosyl hydrolase n=1 Tax=Fodinibius saliphilus TaxID=1920650 RepID=UPI00110884D9|nr:alpha-amylase family glycosyl hydrolase [Fodinibius saliphilus]